MMSAVANGLFMSWCLRGAPRSWTHVALIRWGGRSLLLPVYTYRQIVITSTPVLELKVLRAGGPPRMSWDPSISQNLKAGVSEAVRARARKTCELRCSPWERDG